MPSSEKSHEVHCFAESKVLKNDGKWLQKYELPTRVGKVELLQVTEITNFFPFSARIQHPMSSFSQCSISFDAILSKYFWDKLEVKFVFYFGIFSSLHVYRKH